MKTNNVKNDPRRQREPYFEDEPPYTYTDVPVPDSDQAQHTTPDANNWAQRKPRRNDSEPAPEGQDLPRPAVSPAK